MTTWFWNPLSLIPHETEWTLISSARAMVSPLSGAVQTATRPGTRWGIRITFRQLDEEKRAELRGFLIRMNGLEHRMRFYDFGHNRRGLGGGTPLVKGSGQTGPSLTVYGCTPSVTGWLKRGDWFSVEGQMKMVDRQIDTDVNGEAIIYFRPELRRSPPADHAIDIEGAVWGIFMLADPTVSWRNIPGGLSSFEFELVEDVLAYG